MRCPHPLGTHWEPSGMCAREGSRSPALMRRFRALTLVIGCSRKTCHSDWLTCHKWSGRSEVCADHNVLFGHKAGLVPLDTTAPFRRFGLSVLTGLIPHTDRDGQYAGTALSRSHRAGIRLKTPRSPRSLDAAERTPVFTTGVENVLTTSTEVGLTAASSGTAETARGWTNRC